MTTNPDPRGAVMTVLRSLAVVFLVIAVVASGAMAQDGADAKTTIVLKKVEKKACGPDCTKPCCAKDELLDEEAGECEGARKGCGGCKKAGKCASSSARVVMLSPSKGADLQKALADLKVQIEKLKVEAAALRADKKLAEAEAMTAKAKALEAHVERVRALSSGKTGAFRVVTAKSDAAGKFRLVGKLEAAKAEGCGGACKTAGTCSEQCKKTGECDGSCKKAGKCDGKCPVTGKCGGKCGGKCATAGKCAGKCGGKCAKAGKCGGKCGMGGGRRGFLGIAMASNDDGKVRIVSTVPGSPAAVGGLKADEARALVNGKEVQSIEGAGEIIGKLIPGSMAKLMVTRGTGKAQFGIRLAARPVEVEEVIEVRKGPKAMRRAVGALGVQRKPKAGGFAFGGAGAGAGGMMVSPRAMGRPMANPEVAMLNAKLHEVRAAAQHALAAGDYGKAAKMAQMAHEISAKIAHMQPGRHNAANIERRLAAVEARLARIEAMLHRIAKSLDR